MVLFGWLIAGYTDQATKSWKKPLFGSVDPGRSCLATPDVKKVQGWYQVFQDSVKAITATRDFTSPLWVPSDAVTPKQVLCHHRSAQGRYGGAGTVSILIVQVLCISCPAIRNAPEPRI
jgi:hypothetical protein